MNIDELKEQKNSDNIMLVDIREAEELNDKPMPEGAVHIPMGKVFTEAKKGNLPKDKKIVTICKTGGRCNIVARELNAKGFDVDVLEGGITNFES